MISLSLLRDRFTNLRTSVQKYRGWDSNPQRDKIATTRFAKSKLALTNYSTRALTMKTSS